MSLPELKLSQAVKRQYGMTMCTLGSSFYRNLIFLEIVFCLLAYLSITTYGTTINHLYHLRLRIVSGSQPLWAAMLYVAGMAWVMASDRQRSMAFTFVTNRLSHNLSNVAALCTMSSIAAVVSTLSMVLARVTLTLISGSIVFAEGFRFTPLDLLYCGAAVFGYSFLGAAIAYLTAIILRREPRLFAFVPLVMLLGLKVPLAGDALGDILAFYLAEPSTLLFLLKTVLTALLLFAAACWGSQRLEVRR